MDWPVTFPSEMRSGTVSVTSYAPIDAIELFTPLSDERVWQHMSRPAPDDATELDELISARLTDGHRNTFTIRVRGRAGGITSVVFDPEEPAGAEIGGTLLGPALWGTGVNSAVKGLLLDVVFDHGAEWVRLRTDERNARSAAAIRKLGAVELGVWPEDLVRRDGTPRRSRVFRVDRPSPPSRCSSSPRPSSR